MTSRFLAAAAVLGIVVVTGCSSGGGQSATALTPSMSASASAAATNQASFSVSFLVPVAGTTAPSSVGRNAQYISPGSSGLQVLLSAAGAGTFAIGTQAAPIQLAPTPPTGITAAVNSGAYGSLTNVSPFQSGTAQLSGAIAANPVVASTINVDTIPGSSTITPAIGQTFTVTNTDAPVAGVITLKVASVLGNPGIGFVLTATVTSSIAGTNNAGWTTGNLITWQGGTTTQSTYTYTFTPMSNTIAGSGANGYYQATLTFNNMTGGQNYVIGVVLTDLANNNYILSEGQTGTTAVAASGPTVFPTLALKPVVAGVYIPTPVVQTAAQTAADGAPAGTYESTVFLTDERGYVIVNQTAAPAIDNVNAALINITGSNLTLGNYGAYTMLPATTTSVTTPPTTNTYAAGFPNLTTLGTLLGNYTLPILPATLTLNGSTITNANGVGTPIALTCVGPGTGAMTAKLTSTTPATVGGYTYTPGTNVPLTAQTVLTNSATSIPTVSCNPSIAIPIN